MAGAAGCGNTDKGKDARGTCVFRAEESGEEWKAL